jgi:hypothetical protein
MIMPVDSSKGSEIIKNTGFHVFNTGDGTYNARVFFGDNLCPIIFDSVNERIFFDPDWVAPQLVTQEYVNIAIASSNKHIAFIKQGDTIQTGGMTFEEIDTLCKNEPNKCNVTLAITAMNASGELEAETCYAQNITRCMSLSTGQASYLRFCFVTFNGTTIKFQVNPDNTITNI